MADHDAYPVALYLQDAHDIRTGIDLARRAEDAGFDAVWQADSRLVRDAIVPMAAYAAATERIRIGSGVSTSGRATPARLAVDVLARWTTLLPVASCAGSAPGGTRWRRRSASPARPR